MKKTATERAIKIALPKYIKKTKAVKAYVEALEVFFNDIETLNEIKQKYVELKLKGWFRVEKP